MKTSIPSAAQSSQPAKQSSPAHSLTPQSGPLAQLAAMMNQSPRVQAQLRLADEIENSEPVQNQLALAAEMNQASVTQPQLREEEPVQREEAPSPNNTGLPDQLKAGVENLSGLSLDDVKVHYNSAKPAQLNALAYAQGTDIHIAPGQEKHLPHEAWHIVQQKQGGVKPTLQMKGIRINDDPGLEKNADEMATKVLQDRITPERSASNSGDGLLATVVQRKITTGGGEFDTEKYESYHETNVGEREETALGADIKLTFLPNESVKKAGAEMIGLIQTVRSLKTTREGSRVSSTPEDSPNKAKFKLTADEGEFGWGIDKRDKSSDSTVETNPLYAVENRSDRISESLTDVQPRGGFGDHWFKFSPTKPAKLYDQPRTALEFSEQVCEMSFEVAALIIGGPLKDLYLGSVGWGWKGDEKESKINSLSKLSNGAPSVNFEKAANKWNTWNEGKRGEHKVVGVPSTKGVFSLPDLTQETPALIKATADLMMQEQSEFKGYDSAQKSISQYHLKLMKNELGKREDLTRDSVNEVVSEGYSAKTKEDLLFIIDLRDI